MNLNANSPINRSLVNILILQRLQLLLIQLYLLLCVAGLLLQSFNRSHFCLLIDLMKGCLFLLSLSQLNRQLLIHPLKIFSKFLILFIQPVDLLSTKINYKYSCFIKNSKNLLFLTLFGIHLRQQLLFRDILITQPFIQQLLIPLLLLLVIRFFSLFWRY